MNTQAQTQLKFLRHEKVLPGVAAMQIKIIVERHADGYVAYPLGLKGVVVGEGDTYEEAFADAKSAIQFHIETFGYVQF
jgi:predicted RNase H-like HicB family nuclease